MLWPPPIAPTPTPTPAAPYGFVPYMFADGPPAGRWGMPGY